MTTENNKIIAEFMGFEIKNKINYVPPSLPICMKDAEHLIVNKSENLPFHNDWNWLMEVVEKIESLGYRVTIVRHICRIDLTEESKLIISEDIKKIEAVYTVCFKFIQWYNQNKI